jgi:hypothetical protein
VLALPEQNVKIFFLCVCVSKVKEKAVLALPEQNVKRFFFVCVFLNIHLNIHNVFAIIEA